MTNRRLIKLGLPVVALLALAAAALAFWTSTGTGNAAATTATLNPPTGVQASNTTGSSTVHVSWNASDTSAGAAAPQGYYVTRSDGSAACGSPANLIAGTSCNDSGVPNGSYTYKVVAVSYSWTATSAASNGVTVQVNTDTTPPTVSSITRADASPTNAGSVRWTVTFSEPVTGVDTSDFSLTRGGSLTGGSISAVSGSGASYTVTASTGSGDGTLRLDLSNDGSIHDTAGNALAGGNFTTGESYTVDKTAPSVLSINRNGSAATNSSSVSWTVKFSEPVSGVDTATASDFTLVRSGVTGGTITSVTGSGDTYTVVASTGTGDGTLGLNLVDRDTIVDGAGNTLGGTGAGNGNFTGQVFTIDRTAPATTASLSPATPASGWYTSTASVTLSATDSGGSGVKEIRYTTDGSNPTPSSTLYTGPITVSADGTTTVKFFASDNAGNTESAKSQAVKVDRTGPANGLSLSSQSGNPSYLSGNTIYYDNTGTGQFKLTNAVTDAVSGPASSTFAALGNCSSCGWTLSSSGTVSSPSGGPYVSAGTFSWAKNTTSSPTEQVTAADVAGNTTPVTLTFSEDHAAPTASASVTPAGCGWTQTQTWCATSPASVTLAATDAGGAGVKEIRYTTNGTNPTTTTGTVYTGPITVSADGTTAVKYLAVDNLGHASAVGTQSVSIDTTAPSVTMAAIASPIKGGSVNLSSSSVSDPGSAASGVSSVTYQYSPTGQNNWTNACSATTSGNNPTYQCTFSTSALAEGGYDFRAQARDAAGNIGTSSVISNRVVDNPATGQDVQTANKSGGTAGVLESGDKILYTYSEAMKLDTLVPGWTAGASSGPNVTVTITDGGNKSDTLTVTSPTGTHLGSVDLGGDYITKNAGTSGAGTYTFTGSTISQATNGSTGAQTITITLGTGSSSNSTLNATPASAGTMTWTPDAGALDLDGGQATSTTAVTETGASDAEF